MSVRDPGYPEDRRVPFEVINDYSTACLARKCSQIHWLRETVEVCCVFGHCSWHVMLMSAETVAEAKHKHAAMSTSALTPAAKDGLGGGNAQHLTFAGLPAGE